MNHRFLIPLLFIASCVIGSASADTGTFQVDGAWIAEAPPVSKVMVAYLTITNTGTDSVDIVHAASDLYSSIEFHETIHDGGMARMVTGNVT